MKKAKLLTACGCTQKIEVTVLVAKIVLTLKGGSKRTFKQVPRTHTYKEVLDAKT